MQKIFQKTPTTTANADFLREIQTWLWQRFPARQLSAADTYRAMTWARAGLPAACFIHAFEDFLKIHPDFLKNGCRLSRLQFQADAVIKNAPKQQTQTQNRIPIPDDPFDTALERITACGKNCQNPILLPILRAAFQNLKLAKIAAARKFPHCNTRENFFLYKACALEAFDGIVQNLLKNLLSTLAPAEIERLRTLTPQEKLHCFTIGDKAKCCYKMRIFQRNLALYFHISALLAPL